MNQKAVVYFMYANKAQKISFYYYVIRSWRFFIRFPHKNISWSEKSKIIFGIATQLKYFLNMSVRNKKVCFSLFFKCFFMTYFCPLIYFVCQDIFFF